MSEPLYVPIKREASAISFNENVREESNPMNFSEWPEGVRCIACWIDDVNRSLGLLEPRTPSEHQGIGTSSKGNPKFLTSTLEILEVTAPQVVLSEDLCRRADASIRQFKPPPAPPPQQSAPQASARLINWLAEASISNLLVLMDRSLAVCTAWCVRAYRTEYYDLMARGGDQHLVEDKRVEHITAINEHYKFLLRSDSIWRKGLQGQAYDARECTPYRTRTLTSHANIAAAGISMDEALKHFCNCHDYELGCGESINSESDDSS